MEYSNTTMY